MLNDTSVDVDVDADADANDDDVTSDDKDVDVDRKEGLEVLPSFGGLAEAGAASDS